MDLHRSHTDDVSQTLVGISFENAFRAQEFLLAVGGLAAAGELKLADAVTVLKDQSGKTVVQETVDPHSVVRRSRVRYGQDCSV